MGLDSLPFVAERIDSRFERIAALQIHLEFDARPAVAHAAETQMESVADADPKVVCDQFSFDNLLRRSVGVPRWNANSDALL
jgi:hypothetical protein